MTANASLEERLAAVEAAATQLQQQMASQSANWLQQITGAFKDEPAFEEVLTYGRAIRQGKFRCKKSAMKFAAVIEMKGCCCFT